VTVAGSTPTGARPWPVRGLRVSSALLLVALLALSAAAWLVVARHSHGAMVPSLARPLPLESGHADMGPMSMTAHVGLLLFLGMWVTMMVAMMFPAASPVVIAYWRISRRRSQGPLPPALFVLGYLVVWSAVGLVAYAAYRLVLAASPSLSPQASAVIGGLALVVAGVYQWSSPKSACLRRCRGPFELAFAFRPGARGAVRTGTEHGLFCLGCCWGLMVVLFVLGLMNLAWMGVIAAVIFVEKLFPRPDVAVRAVGAVLVAAGAVLIGSPALVGTGVFG
jgi:predicted metal-binding membrane protein